MSQEELPSAPTADTLCTGDVKELQAGVKPTPTIEFVPISIVQRMELDLNEAEAWRRYNAKKVQDYVVATAIAEQIVESLNSHLPTCSSLGAGPLLGLISSFNQAMIKARIS